MKTQRTTTDPPIRLGIIVLALGTALTHLTLNFPDPVFILNGVGYVALLGALYLPIPQLVAYRRTTRWLLIGYTVLTIVLWIAIGACSSIGYINKINEIVLIALLLFEDRRMRR
jgi:uncharacterized membrane protein